MIDTRTGALAFGLTCGAGLATTIGAAVVFNKRLIHHANNRFLAMSLSLSAGVMLYVSMVEIFVKSQSGFEDAGFSEPRANVCATACFFGGIGLGNLLDWIVHKINGESSDEAHEFIDIDQLQGQLEELELSGFVRSNKEESKLEPNVESIDCISLEGCKERNENIVGTSENTSKDPEEQDKHLVKMGLMTALAIGIHNFPEGLATFVGTLDDPVVGFGLAVAIAIHNIPEGLCVSIPIYYATKDRWTAFKWAFISGISEPIGAGLGWAILYRIMDDTAYGVIFGLVAGMMVNICIHELVPTAFRYDPKDVVVTKSFIAGMAIMAASLLAFASA